MSELRRQLEAARQQHREQTYPGDLAADVLARVSAGRPRSRYWIGAAVASAIAAGVALMIFVRPPASPPPSTGVWPGTLARITPPGPPDMPAGLPIVPPHQSVSNIPSRPSFPSLFSPAPTEEAL
jgi:hypothetical protein